MRTQISRGWCRWWNLRWGARRPRIFPFHQVIRRFHIRSTAVSAFCASMHLAICRRVANGIRVNGDSVPIDFPASTSSPNFFGGRSDWRSALGGGCSIVKGWAGALFHHQVRRSGSTCRDVRFSADDYLIWFQWNFLSDRRPIGEIDSTLSVHNGRFSAEEEWRDCKNPDQEETGSQANHNWKKTLVSYLLIIKHNLNKV